MNTEEKIQTDDFVEEIKTALKDIFVAKTRKHLDEIHMKFPNGQEFVVAVWEADGENVETGGLAKHRLEELSREDYNRWFEDKMSNWIKNGIYLALGLEAEQQGNEIYVSLANGQRYTVVIQKG